MGWLSKAFKKVVKVATLGAVDSEAKKKAERQAKAQQAAMDAEVRRAEQEADQAANRNRQESADLAALQDDNAGGTGEMAGILTSVDGLVKGDRKLGKKKALGG